MSNANYIFFTPPHFGIRERISLFEILLRRSQQRFDIVWKLCDAKVGPGWKLFLNSFTLVKKN